MLPAFFHKIDTMTQLFADINEDEDSILLCGTTKTTNVLTASPSYFSGYILGYSL